MSDEPKNRSRAWIWGPGTLIVLLAVYVGGYFVLCGGGAGGLPFAEAPDGWLTCWHGHAKTSPALNQRERPRSRIDIQLLSPISAAVKGSHVRMAGRIHSSGFCRLPISRRGGRL